MNHKSLGPRWLLWLACCVLAIARGQAQQFRIAGNNAPLDPPPARWHLEPTAYLDSPPNVYLSGAGVMDPAGNYMYFGKSSFKDSDTTVSVNVIRLRLSDFGWAGETSLKLYPSPTFHLEAARVISALMDTMGEYAYFRVSNQGPYDLFKIRLSDFSPVASLTFAPNELFRSPDTVQEALDSAAGFAYFCVISQPNSKIVKVRLSDLTRVDELILDKGAASLPLIDAPRGFAYFSLSTQPARVIRVRLSDFTRVDSLDLASSDLVSDFWCIDPGGEFAYFGRAKVRLSDFTRVGTIPDFLHAGPSLLEPAGYIYSPNIRGAGIIKDRLADFVRAGVLPLEQSRFLGPIPVAFDPAGTYGYFYCAAQLSYPRFTIVKQRLDFENPVHLSQITLTEPADVSDLRFYDRFELDRSIHVHRRLAIYDNQPSPRLLWQSGSLSEGSEVNQWLVARVATGTPPALALAPGVYWLAWQSDQIEWDLQVYTPSENPHEGFYFTQPYGEFPAVIDQSRIQWTGLAWDEYLTYNLRNGVKKEAWAKFQ